MSNSAPVCGATKPNGRGVCHNPAGFGTEHVGHGRCKFHGGSTVTHVVHAEKLRAIERMRTYGLPIDTDPQTALIDEVKRTAGHVAWLNDQLSVLPDEISSVTQWTKDGEKPSALVELYQGERQHLARVCKMALDAGVAERSIKLAEDQGALLAQVIKGVLDDLNLSRAQRDSVPEIVRRHLTAVA